MTFDPTSIEVIHVPLPKDYCVLVPWKYIIVCGYSDPFFKSDHTLQTATYTPTHMDRMSDHIVSFGTKFRRDNNHSDLIFLGCIKNACT